MTTPRPNHPPTTATAPAGRDPEVGLVRDFGAWLNAELGKPGFSMTRMLFVCLVCVATMMVLEPLTA